MLDSPARGIKMQTIGIVLMVIPCLAVGVFACFHKEKKSWSEYLRDRALKDIDEAYAEEKRLDDIEGKQE